MMTLVLTALAFASVIVSHLANPVVTIASEEGYDYR